MCLYRVTLHLAQPLPQRSGYALYAWLLARCPAGAAQQIHAAQLSPVCQYLDGLLWHITLCGTACAEALLPLLQTVTAVQLHCMPHPTAVLHREVQCITPEALLEQPPAPVLQLDLRSPTAFKSGGCYQLLPTPRLVLQSQITRWNATFGEVYPIPTDDPALLDALADGLMYRQLSLQSVDYRLKRQQIPGVVGSLQAHHRAEGLHLTLANALLMQANWTGMGIKTALGMGGVQVCPSGAAKPQ